MFSPASLFRIAFSRFRPTISTVRAAARALNASARFQQSYRLPNYLPTTLGFSLLTLLGLEPETTPEDELIKSIKYSILFIQRSQFEKAERLLHVALRQAQQMYHEQGITYVYDVMANLALQREELDKAKKLFVSVAQRLMQNGATEDDLRIIHISLKLARISHLKKEHRTAQTGFEWCIEKLEKELIKRPSENVTKLMALAEDWYGMLFLDCNEPEKCLALLKRSHERASSLSDFEAEHTVIQLNDLATVCERLERLDDSERYLKEAIEIGKDLTDMNDFGAIYVNLGRVYLKKGLVDEARKSCGYGWRLGYDRKNESVKEQAMKCVEDIKRS